MKKRPATKSIVLQRNDREKVIACIEGGRVWIHHYGRRSAIRDGNIVQEPGYWTDFEEVEILDFEAARTFAEWVLRVVPVAEPSPGTHEAGASMELVLPAWIHGKELRCVVEVPAWAREIPAEVCHDDALTEVLRDDLNHAFARRAIAVARGANDTPKGLKLMSRGDAVLARSVKAKSYSTAFGLTVKAEDLYDEAVTASRDTRPSAPARS